MTPARLSETAFKLEARKRGFHVQSVLLVSGKLRIQVVHDSGWRITVNALSFENALEGLAHPKIRPTLEAFSEENAGGPDSKTPGTTTVRI